jgi:hypothetical protein
MYRLSQRDSAPILRTDQVSRALAVPMTNLEAGSTMQQIGVRVEQSPCERRPIIHNKSILLRGTRFSYLSAP